ncbi:MAG: biotin--[acetyl-CoA-carboxylase] ligase [Planctomycetota bacterium]|nr:biotin--[acetyl-CoA-carboxylase] ligase [Planctomycetota bacterium]
MPRDEPLFAGEAAAEAFADALPTRELGRAVAFHPRASSTNDLALEAARAGAPHGLLVAADEQTAGRGRRGRTWEAPPGAALLFSVLVRGERLPRERFGWLALAAGLAAAEALHEAAGLKAVPKWPNDVVVTSAAARAPAPAWRKLGGVLCESQLPPDPRGAAGAGYVVIGMGLNVLQDAHELPPLPKAPATSVKLELGRETGRRELLAAVLARLELRLDELGDDDGFTRFRAELGARLEHAWGGLTLHLTSAGKERAGRWAGLDEHGRLRLALPDGSVAALADAEILAVSR